MVEIVLINITDLEREQLKVIYCQKHLEKNNIFYEFRF